MTPQEKAKQLIKMFQFETEINEILVKFNTHKSEECALIAVDEIIGAIDWHEFETPNKELIYWQEVKQEIEKL
jgi:hypothetical protein